MTKTGRQDPPQIPLVSFFSPRNAGRRVFGSYNLLKESRGKMTWGASSKLETYSKRARNTPRSLSVVFPPLRGASGETTRRGKRKPREKRSTRPALFFFLRVMIGEGHDVFSPGASSQLRRASRRCRRESLRRAVLRFPLGAGAGAWEEAGRWARYQNSTSAAAAAAVGFSARVPRVCAPALYSISARSSISASTAKELSSTFKARVDK